MNNVHRCQKRRKGYVSSCDKPAKFGFRSVHDPLVVFWLCGIHKRTLEKYVTRGSFYETDS